MLFLVKQEPENRTPEGAEPGHWGFAPCSMWADARAGTASISHITAHRNIIKTSGVKSCPARGARETRGAEPDPTVTQRILII